MAHSHSHSHGGGLKNTPVRVLYICLVINLLFVVAEALAGWQSNSTGSIANARGPTHRISILPANPAARPSALRMSTHLQSHIPAVL